ncbi:MAG: hypothetical protein ACYCQK_02645 [Acidiferrobacteraceae bacterium]
MTEAARILHHTLRRVAAAQAALIVFAALVAAWLGRNHAWGSVWAGAGALYGGLVSLFIAWRLARSLDGGGSGRLYLGALERFVSVALFLGLGLAVLHLEPLAVIGGFALAQLGFLAGARPVPPRVGAR